MRGDPRLDRLQHRRVDLEGRGDGDDVTVVNLDGVLFGCDEEVGRCVLQRGDVGRRVAVVVGEGGRAGDDRAAAAQRGEELIVVGEAGEGEDAFVAEERALHDDPAIDHGVGVVARGGCALWSAGAPSEYHFDFVSMTTSKSRASCKCWKPSSSTKTSALLVNPFR